MYDLYLLVTDLYALSSAHKFRAFLAYLDGDIEIRLPGSHPTIAAWVKQQ